MHNFYGIIAVLKGKGMELNSRMQAAAKSMTTYWNGEPCRKGHSSGRYVSTNACVACQNAANAAAKTNYSAKLVTARVLGLVEMTVLVPPGTQDDVNAFVAALVIERDGTRKSQMDAMIMAGPAGQLFRLNKA